MKIATFETCVPHILKWEGGYVNHPQDPGGETNFGISKASYPNLDIKNLTIEQARSIYKSDYWDKNHLNDFEMPLFIKLAFFDACVNTGYSAALKVLQQSLNITSDGIYGPQTKAALSVSKPELLHTFLTKRAWFYMSLSGWKTFGLGWMNRLIDTAIESGKFLV